MITQEENITEVKLNEIAEGIAIITVPANLNYSAAVRDFTLASLKNVANMDEKWSYRIQLAVDEIFMNAVRYGSNQTSYVKLTYDFAPHRVTIIIEDSGTGKNHLSARQLQEQVATAQREHEERLKRGEKNLAISGRGLSQLVVTWVDQLRFEDSPSGGIKVSIIKAI